MKIKVINKERIKICFENVKKSLDRQKHILEEKEYKRMLDLVDDEVWKRRSAFVNILVKRILDQRERE